MKSLAKGTSSEAIFKLLKVTINTQQMIFAEATMNITNIEDIATSIETEKKLFADQEQDGIEYNDIDTKEERELKKSYVGEQIDDDIGSPEMKATSGKRSTAFNFLLDSGFN